MERGLDEDGKRKGRGWDEDGIKKPILISTDGCLVYGFSLVFD